MSNVSLSLRPSFTLKPSAQSLAPPKLFDAEFYFSREPITHITHVQNDDNISCPSTDTSDEEETLQSSWHQRAVLGDGGKLRPIASDESEEEDD